MKSWSRLWWQATRQQATSAVLQEDRENSCQSSATKQAELASCRLSYAACFSILSPVIGYAYTGRFKPLGFFMVSSFVVLIGAMSLGKLNLDSEKSQVSLGLGVGGVAAIDNSRAVLLARRKTRRIKAFVDRDVLS